MVFHAVCDHHLQVSILSRGNGIHAFGEDKAARIADDVIKCYASSDGKLRVEGFCEFIKEEKRFQAMATEEKQAWYDENSEYDYTREEVMGAK